MDKPENIGFGGIKLFQDNDGFRYGVDAVLVAEFAHRIRPDARRIVDLGTGNGVIPLILSHKNKKCIVTGIDVQQKAIDLANKSCQENDLQDRIDFQLTDIQAIANKTCQNEKVKSLLGSVDVVVSNPPYVAKGSGLTNGSEGKFIARQETTADFRDFAKAASLLLGDKGDFFIVHRPSRLTDLLCACREFRLEPKDIQFVVPKKGKAPNIVLIHCRCGAGRELKYLPELAVYNDCGDYTQEINRIYER